MRNIVKPSAEGIYIGLEDTSTFTSRPLTNSAFIGGFVRGLYIYGGSCTSKMSVPAAKKRSRLLFEEMPAMSSTRRYEFDEEIQLDKIISITDIRTTNANRKRGLAYAAFFMCKAACEKLAASTEHDFVYTDSMRQTLCVENAIASMYILADAITAPVHNTKFKLLEVEGSALESCLFVCNEVLS